MEHGVNRNRKHEHDEPAQLTFAIVTCSDTRSKSQDTAGAALEELIANAGWQCVSRVTVMDERADIAEHAHLRMLTHRAGVDDDDIGGEFVLRKGKAHLREIAADALGIALVLLAAVGVHQRQRTAAAFFVQRPDFSAYFHLLRNVRSSNFGSLISHRFVTCFFP